ncbi:MAG: redoxin family protein [Bacteroidaceae bacterium]|nr:redoxin family protein [Bacteroidaceae bacterium]
MKKQTIITILFALVAMAGQAKVKTIVWEEPHKAYTVDPSFEVLKVELTKEKTILYARYRGLPKGELLINKDSYLQADGKQYAIIGSDSIQLGNKSFIDDRGEKKFVLYFKPFPKKTKEFDFIEGMGDDDFRVFGIHDKDFTMPAAPVPAGYLADLAEDDQAVEMKYSEKPVTIHFKALNYRKGMQTEITLRYVNLKNPARHGGSRLYLNDDGEGEASLHIGIPQQVTADISNISTTSFAELFLAPGKEVTILVDMLHDDKDGNGKFVGYKGYAAKLFWEYRPASRNFLSKTEYSFQKMLECKDVTSLINFMKGRNASVEEWRKMAPYGEAVKDELQTYFNMPLILSDNVLDSLKQTEAFVDYISRNHAPDVLSSIRYFDYDFVMTCQYYVKDKEARGFNADLARYCYYLPKVLDGQKVEKPLIEDPQLSALYDNVVADYQKTVAVNKQNLADNIHYLDMTDVAPENILRTILDKYKGKTVFIDIWATWCGPCRYGHKEMAPLKEELKGEDIQFIYITSPSSPYKDWKGMIGEIPGDHYYLTKAQYDVLLSLYKSKGIPTYAIYDADGKQTYTFVGFPGVETFKEEINKALNK